MKDISGKIRVLVAVFAVGFFPVSGMAQSYSVMDTSSLDFSEKNKEVKNSPVYASALLQHDIDAVAPVTDNELQLFVRDWKKYSHWLKSDGNQYKAVAYLGVDNTADYPPEVIHWMDEHGWATDRFFLLERKFRTTLAVLEQETKRTNLLKHVERQIRQLEENQNLTLEQKRQMKDRYIDTIHTIRSATAVKAPVSSDEYELIKLNRSVLAQVLDE